MVVKLEEYNIYQEKLAKMEIAVKSCDSTTPEWSQAAMRFLDISHYVEKEIDEEKYFEEMDKIAILANTFRHHCSCKNK